VKFLAYDVFQAPNGDAVAITMARDPSGPNWSSSMSMGSSKVKDSFPIAYKNFNQVWSLYEGV
jgi:hypothetical protein